MYSFDPSELAPETDLSPGKKPGRSRRRRWIWWLSGGFLGIILLLLLASGPAFPLVGKWVFQRVAAAQGIEGDLRLSGSLWGNISLRDVSLDGSQGESGLISLELEEATAAYSPIALLFGFNNFEWLERIHVHDASLVLVLPEPGTETEEKPQEERKTKEAASDFSPIWNLLASSVKIDNLSLEIREGERTYQVGAFEFQLSQSGESRIVVEDISLPDAEKPLQFSTEIEPGEHEITLRNLNVGGESSISFLSITESEPGEFELKSELEVAGGILTALVKSRGEATIGLRNRSQIDLSKLPLESESELPLAGKITDFDLSFLGAFEDPSTWKLSGSVVGNGITWEQKGIDTLAITLKNDRLSLEALRPDARLVATVRYPYSGAQDLEGLAEVSAFAEATVEVPSIQKLVTNLAGENDWHGSMRVDLKEFELRGGNELRNGRFLVTSQDLRWKDEAISNLQAAATVGADETVVLAVNVALDPQTQLDLDGTLDLTTRSYQGEAELELEMNERLADILSSAEIALREGSGGMKWTGSGNLEKNVHQGEATFSVTDLRYAGGVPFSLSTRLNYEGENFEIPELTLTSFPLNLSAAATWNGETIRILEGRLVQEDTARGTFSAAIPFQPSSETPALETSAPLELKLALERLGIGPIATLFLEKPPVAGDLSGTLKAAGSFRDLTSKGDFQFWPASVIESSPDAEIGASPLGSELANSQLDIDYDFEGELSNPSTWTIDLLADLSGFLWKGKEIETLSLTAKTQNSDATNRLHAKIDGAVSAATLAGTALIDLTEVSTLSDLGTPPIGLDLDFNAPDLAEPWRDFAPAEWQSIPIAGALAVQIENGVWNQESLTSGTLHVFSDSFRILDEPIEKIEIDGKVTRPNFIELTTHLRADEASHLEGKGQFELQEQTYASELDAEIDLVAEGVLKRLLAGRNIASLLPARTSAHLAAGGNLAEKTVSGDYDLTAETLVLAPKAAPIRRIESKGEFSEKSLIASLSVDSEPIALNGKVDWEEGMLQLREWVGVSGNRTFLTLDGSVPLDPEAVSAEKWFASEVPIVLRGKIDTLPFSTIYRLIGEEPPVQGEVSLDLDVGGTPAAPSVDIDLGLGKLFVTGENAIAAGEIDLGLVATDGKARLEGAYRHPDVNPLQIEAQMPFRPAVWATEEGSFLKESISLSADMERSSLSFLATQIPAIESIAGTIALDLDLAGTMAAPEISGQGAIGVERLRLQAPGAPSFYDIELDTSFSKNEVRIDRLSAIIAGGIVEAGGVAKFLPDSPPVLDFQLQGREILLFRTPDLSLRTDADIQLQGPFSEVNIRGEIGLVNSRFFKNFDLLPTSISLPDASSLPSVEQGPRGGGAAYSDLNMGVQIEPFSNWTADIRVYTKDPFLIRSNLIESSLVADLHIGGTLERPAPNGFIEIAEGSLSLPFSTVDVDTGRINFDEITGFNGAIELKARAKADKYRINAYLYNRMLDPKYVLTSVPPMPPEDILTLIATGTTRDELIGGDPGALAASKAATLLFKNLRKADTNLNREPNLLDELNERTELEIGGINPETGAETIGGKIRLWKQLFFVGNVDAQNDYRAVLKYVFRFR